MFWDNFSKLCEKNGVKPNTVCRELGFSTAIATHWKHGQLPKSDRLQMIADYFGVSADYLLSGNIKKEPEQTSRDEIRAQIGTLVDDMSDEKQLALLNLLKTL